MERIFLWLIPLWKSNRLERVILRIDYTYSLGSLNYVKLIGMSCVVITWRSTCRAIFRSRRNSWVAVERVEHRNGCTHWRTSNTRVCYRSVRMETRVHSLHTGRYKGGRGRRVEVGQSGGIGRVWVRKAMIGRSGRMRWQQTRVMVHWIGIVGGMASADAVRVEVIGTWNDMLEMSSRRWCGGRRRH